MTKNLNLKSAHFNINLQRRNLLLLQWASLETSGIKFLEEKNEQI